MKQRVDDWGFVRVPRAFKERVELFINEHPELGYRSVREFFVTAAREKMDEIILKEEKLQAEVAQE